MSENLDTIEYDPEHPQEHTDLWNELCAEDVGKMEVKCFYSFDEENGKNPILTINIGEYNW